MEIDDDEMIIPEGGVRKDYISQESRISQCIYLGEKERPSSRGQNSSELTL